MRRAAKVFLIIALVLVLAGGGVFVWGMTKLNWNFSDLASVEYETNTFEITESFKDLSFDLNTADIVIKPAEDGVCRVVFREYEDEKHRAYVQGDTLMIAVEAQVRFAGFGFFPENLSATVYLPGNSYRALSVRTNTGDADFPEGFSFERADISTSTGDVSCGADISGKLDISTDTGDAGVTGIKAGEVSVETKTGEIKISRLSCGGSFDVNTDTGDSDVSDVRCKSFDFECDTGDAVFTNVIAEGLFSADSDTGDIKLVRCDAAGMKLESDTGDITGSLLSEKIFITEKGSGDIRVPKTSSGGRCEIKTTTGDVDIVIDGEAASARS